MGIVSLMTSTNYNSLGNDINIVGTFSTGVASGTLDKYVSPPLLNYVEPYEYKGVNKTLFYTEVNTNFNVGDKVFIINGNYDSAELIKSDKYRKGRDGYNVLFVDRCRVVLDIDWTGELPNNGKDSGSMLSDYVKVYYIDSRDSFITANRQLTSRGGYMGGKFDLYQNNIAFIDSDYENINDGWTKTTGVTASPGFYVREQAYDPNLLRNTKGETWINITDSIISGTLSIASSDTNTSQDLRFYNNGKILIAGLGFFYNGQEFKSGHVYKWDGTMWSQDIQEQSTWTKAIITKGNFRSGIFKGKFNDGVYGSKSKRIKWTGEGTWLGGTLLNSTWQEGSMFSTITLPESHQAYIDINGNPIQKVNTYNNGGYGFNYVIESDFDSSSIYSAIVRNTKFGTTPNLSVVEDFITGTTSNYEHTISNGLFESCEFNNTLLNGGAVKNSRTRNSMLKGVKHINSWAYDTVFDGSSIITEPVIKVDGYEEWSASEKRNSIYGTTFSATLDLKVYKFYIGEADYLKLRQRDSFYIKGLKIKGDQSLLNLFDRKFTIGSWTEYVDDFDYTKNLFYKRGINCAAFLVTPEENDWIYSSVEIKDGNNTKGFITDTIKINPNPRYSIDIFISTRDINKLPINGLNFNSPTQSVSSLDYIPVQTSNTIDITTAYIIDSNIESGIVNNSVWTGTHNIGYNKDLIVSGLSSSAVLSDYNITFDNTTGNITATTLTDPNNIEIIDRFSNINTSDINTDDILFISGLDYYSRGKVIGVTISASGSNYVNSISPSKLVGDTSGYGLTIQYTATNDSNAGIDSITIVDSGLDYNIGDTLLIPNLNGGTASIQITSIDTTQPIRLPDTWKVVSNITNLELSPLFGTDIIKGLTSGGVFRTDGAENRWGAFSRIKITNSNIKSGMLRRSLLTSNTISNSDYDSTDKDFTKPEMIKSLVISDMVFSGTGNKLGAATYHNINLMGGTDIWSDGIIYKSVINNITFGKGTIKESSWKGGTFNGGLFYWSKSYDANPIDGLEVFSDNRILSHYKSGKTEDSQGKLIYNDRYSWKSGIFNGGIFNKSDWEGGIFNGGLFNGAKWYGGTASGGQFGERTTSTNETLFYNGVVTNTTVENAIFIADDTSKTGITNSIYWQNGTFNGGLFGSNETIVGSKIPDIIYTVSTTTPVNGSIYGNYNFNSSTPTLELSTIVTETTNSLEEIKVEIDYSINPTFSINYLEILLIAPNGKVVTIKKNGTGTDSILTNTIFSSSNTTPFINGSTPYTGTFMMDTITLSELIDSTNGISGLWTLRLNNTGYYLMNIDYQVDMNATISFTPKGTQKIITNNAVWSDGVFNGGQFIDSAIWKNGTFNSGKFLSTYGWTMSGSYSTLGTTESHSWQGGVFNGGEFGNGTTGSNSTWYTGEFNDGTFKGRVWSNGIFRYGNFIGSGLTAMGGWDLNTISTQSNAIDFANSFKNGDFYGLWRWGLVTDQKDMFIEDKKFYTELQRNASPDNSSKIVKFENVLWKDGYFSHKSGTINNSIWLSGQFSDGLFKNSSFNPYLKRDSGPYFSTGYDQNNYPNIIWTGGKLENSDFYVSEWTGGEFISGTAIGMWFKDGISYYMNAYNVTWGTTSSVPVWKNGNWYGSEFDYNGSITNPLQREVLDITSRRNSQSLTQFRGGNTLHIWNAFEDKSQNIQVVIGVSASNIETYISETISNGYTVYYPPVVW